MGAGRGTLRLGLKVKTTAEVARISRASTSSPCPLSATVKVRGVGLQGDTTLKHITITSKQTRHHPERKDTPRKHENTSLPGIFPGNGINPSFSHLKTAGYEDKKSGCCLIEVGGGGSKEIHEDQQIFKRNGGNLKITRHVFHRKEKEILSWGWKFHTRFNARRSRVKLSAFSPEIFTFIHPSTTFVKVF